MNKGKITTVEGIIGVGKTWRCKNLEQYIENLNVKYEIHLLNPYLERFYVNPKKWAYPMQMFMLEGRRNIWVEIERLIQSGENVVADRSIYSDIVFALTNKDNMSTDEWRRYIKRKNEIVKNFCVPDIVEYLYVAPEICHKDRIPSRLGDNPELECEKLIPLDYLKLLENVYIGDSDFEKKGFVEECIDPNSWLGNMKKIGCEIKLFDWSKFGSEYSEHELFSHICQIN